MSTLSGERNNPYARMDYLQQAIGGGVASALPMAVPSAVQITDRTVGWSMGP